MARTKLWVTFLLGWQSEATAPRLEHLVEHAQLLIDLCGVLLMQTQVLQRMLPETTDCFSFVPGQAQQVGGGLPGHVFDLWLRMTCKLLAVLREAASVWQRLGQQLEAKSPTGARNPHARRLPEREKVPGIATEMVSLALSWRMHVPLSAQAHMKKAFKRLVDANKSRSAICALLAPPAPSATAAPPPPTAPPATSAPSPGAPVPSHSASAARTAVGDPGALVAPPPQRASRVSTAAPGAGAAAATVPAGTEGGPVGAASAAAFTAEAAAAAASAITLAAEESVAAPGRAAAQAASGAVSKHAPAKGGLPRDT